MVTLNKSWNWILCFKSEYGEKVKTIRINKNCTIKRFLLLLFYFCIHLFRSDLSLYSPAFSDLYPSPFLSFPLHPATLLQSIYISLSNSVFGILRLLTYLLQTLAERKMIDIKSLIKVRFYFYGTGFNMWSILIGVCFLSLILIVSWNCSLVNVTTLPGLECQDAAGPLDALWGNWRKKTLTLHEPFS